MGEPPVQDVTVIGGGPAGGLLAAVLARAGVGVTLLDSGTVHAPTDVTTVPQTSFHFELIAARYGVPEIAVLADSKRLRRTVSPRCGPQQTLGFLHHQEGRPADGYAALQFNVPGEHGESHLYRPDIDQWLVTVATGYGCRVRRAQVTEVVPGPDTVEVRLADGGSVVTRCVVDTSGPDSPVAAALGSVSKALPSPGPVRVVSAELTGVRPLEELVPPLPGSRPWSAGTVHHVFDGGVLWLAPFGEGAGCAAGLCLDGRRHPGSGDPAEDLFATVGRFPTLARQFDTARIRRACADDAPRRLASVRTADRMLLLDRAAFCADPLFGRDAAATAELVCTVAGDLIAAVRDDDFGAARFGYTDRLQAAMAESGARLAAAALTATRDARLWSALARVWLLGSMFGALTLKKQLKLLQAGALEPAFAGLRRPPDGGTSFGMLSGYAALLESALTACERADAGDLTPGRAAETVFAAIRSARCVPPIFGFGDPADREYVLTLPRRLRTLAWLRRSAPDDVRALLGSYGLRGNKRIDA